MIAELQKQKLGYGIYTVSDISRILELPKISVRRYLTDYWDKRFGIVMFNDTYSWQSANVKIVNFSLLIEFFTVFRLKELGVSSFHILKARESIAKDLNTPYPFATSPILSNGKRIWYEFDDSIIKADGKKQMYFTDMLKSFCEKIDFNGDKLVQRFWPRGKQNSIIVDPHHQFGQPVIFGTNINAEVIYSMFYSGESIKTIEILYDISEKEIKDAIDFYKIVA